MRSHLLDGVVRHRRVRPFAYALEHDVFYVALDLDELDEVPRRIRSISRAAGISCRSATPIISTRRHATCAPGIHDHLRAEGWTRHGWRVTLVTNLRVLGYVFNPGQLLPVPGRRRRPPSVIVEVHNTHGERHLYTPPG